MAGIRKRMQVCLQRNVGYIDGNGNKLRPLEIRIYYVFALNIEIKTSFFTTTFY